MKCPACAQQNKKSTVQTGPSMSACVSYSGYYDEDGKYHHHDDNAVTTDCRCSNGHHFAYSPANTCWCGWEGKKEKYQIL
jgi:hypothetical protein